MNIESFQDENSQEEDYEEDDAQHVKAAVPRENDDCTEVSKFWRWFDEFQKTKISALWHLKGAAPHEFIDQRPTAFSRAIQKTSISLFIPKLMLPNDAITTYEPKVNFSYFLNQVTAEVSKMVHEAIDSFASLWNKTHDDIASSKTLSERCESREDYVSQLKAIVESIHDCLEYARLVAPAVG